MVDAPVLGGLRLFLSLHVSIYQASRADAINLDSALARLALTGGGIPDYMMLAGFSGKII
jgi:hypothetical protein